MSAIVVICGIIEHEGRVLITQRSATMSQPLLWEFPGGKLEPNETEEACLIREIKEELGISVVPKYKLSTSVHRYATTEIKLIPYVCAYASGVIALLEHAAYKWVNANALPAFDWCPADVPIANEYLVLRKG